MLYLSEFCDEQCKSDKSKIRIICPHIWIHYIIDGKGFYNGIPLKKGEAFIVYKGDKCTYYPDPDDPWRYVWIRLVGDDTEGLLDKCGLPKSSGIFSFSYFQELVTLAAAVPIENIFLGNNRPYAEAAAKLVLSLNYTERPTEIGKTQQSYVQAATDYIDLNYHKRLSIEDIANDLHIDRKYLHNLFVRFKGISTKEYMINVKLNRAKELLQDTDQSVGIIARSVGYDDALAFSKLFKKHTGLSPMEYRKLYR